MYPQFPLSHSYYPMRGLSLTTSPQPLHVSAPQNFPTTPKSVHPQALSNIRQQNEKSLELLSSQLKMFSDLSAIKDLDEFKSQLPEISSNLQVLTESILKSHRGIVEIMESNGIRKEELKKNIDLEIKELREAENLKILQAKLVALEEDNKNLKAFIERSETQTKEALNEKNEEILKLSNILREKNEELLKFSKFQKEKEELEKNIDVLVNLNEKLKKNYEQAMIDLDTNKSRCNVLMDINSELRDSLEIVIHENKKLNIFFNPEHKKKEMDEDQEE